jgi:predicted nicotinamide N-methyase
LQGTPLPRHRPVIDVKNASPAGDSPDERLDALLARSNGNLQRTLPMARIEVQPLPRCPDIRLGLINPDFSTAPLPPEVMRDVIARPAYWALCWGSGLGLARLLYQNPQWVRGRRVLDLGSGSGIVAIAAARNGARDVIACDNDPDALTATACNAAMNGVTLTLIDALDELSTGCDLVLMADVLYDASNLPLLQRAARVAANVMVADSRVTTIPAPGFRQIAELSALTFPNLGEFDEFGTVRVWVAGPALT